jgi:hypothetical protein
LSNPKPDPALVEQEFDYPPLLNALVPMVILITSAVYAWSLRNVVNIDMNLLLLKPLFIAIWGFLLIIIVNDVVPVPRQQREWRRRKSRAGIGVPWQARFAPGTEAGAALVVAATFVFTFFGPGDGAATYLVSAFIYLTFVGYVIGDRNPIWLFGQAAVLAAGLYFIMGVLLGVRL